MVGNKGCLMEQSPATDLDDLWFTKVDCQWFVTVKEYCSAPFASLVGCGTDSAD